MSHTSTTADKQAGDSLLSEDAIFIQAERRCEDYVIREMGKRAMPMCHCICALTREAATDVLRSLLQQRTFVIDALNALVERLKKAADSQLEIYRAQPSHVLALPFGKTAEQQAQAMVKRGIWIAITLLMRCLEPMVGENIGNYDWVKKVRNEEAERMEQLVSEEFDRLRLEYEVQAELIDANRQSAKTGDRQAGEADDVASKALVRKLEGLVGALAEGEKEAKAPAEAKAMETSRVTAGAAGEAATEAGVGGGEDPPPKPLSLEEMMKLLVTEAGGDEGLGPDRTNATAVWYVNEMKTRWGREYTAGMVRKTKVWKKVILPARRDAKREKQTKVSLQEGGLPPDRHHKPRHWGEYDDNSDD